MTFTVIDNILNNPFEYILDIYNKGFKNVDTENGLFRNIQERAIDGTDEFAKFVSFMYPDYEVVTNFARMSPYEQPEPTFIHTDEDMGDITCILYLSSEHPSEDGTTIYDENCNRVAVIHSRFNRMCSFDSRLLHSRNIYDNFGYDRKARLIQVIFLKEKK